MTSPFIVTSFTSASKPLIEKFPQAVHVGAPFSPPVLSWKALPSSSSVAVMSWVSPFRSLQSSSSSPVLLRPFSSSTTFPSPLSDMPPTWRCDRASPSIRDPIASTAWLATVRPKRVSHAFGIGPLLVMVPVAVASESRAPPVAPDRVIVKVSLPSSMLSSKTVTEIVFESSPALNVRVPDFAV